MLRSNPMSLLVVVVLSVLWLAFFIPGLRDRRSSSPYASAATFQECLARISTGRAVDAEQVARQPRPRLSRRQIQRRRDTLLGLSGAVVAGAILGMSLGGAAILLVVPPLLAVVSYLVVLRADVVRAAERRAATPAPPPAAPRLATAPEDGDVVPSVKRRAEVPELERIAG